MNETRGVARHALGALVVLLIALASACGGGTGGSATGGGSGTGSGGVGGAAGHATGGSGGSLAGAGGQATGGLGGSAGALGGRAGNGAAGATGGAASVGGAAGSGLFPCIGVTPYGACIPGQVCQDTASESVQFCNCGTSARWSCGSAGYCATAMSPGASCDVATVAALGGCKFSPATLCTCQSSPDGGTAFSCQDTACPSAQPTGTCGGGRVAAACYYQAKTVSCFCQPVDAGLRRWLCNDQLTPDCPMSSPGSGAACTAYQPGATCSYPAGDCTCNMNGSSQTWTCG